MLMNGLSLPERLRRRVESSLDQRRLERDFVALMATAQWPRKGDGRARIGVATFGSGNWHLVLEVLLSHALERRGAATELLLCDVPDLPICDERNVFTRRGERCPGCVDDKRRILDACGLRWRGVSDVVGADALARATGVIAALRDDELEAFECDGHPIGRWLHVSASHYLRGDARGNTPDRISVRRRLLISATIIVEAVTRWLDTMKPDVVIAESGAHFMWRIAFELARARGIPVVCREMGKGGWDRHIYALNADSMSPDLDAAWVEARATPLTAGEDAAVAAFIDSLAAQTYVTPHQSPAVVPPHKGGRMLVAFANVTWDLATAGRDVSFTGVFDWLKETIEAVDGEGGVRLIVRAHPAEAAVATRERVAEQIASCWPTGLAHLTVLGPEDDLPAAQLCAAAELVTVYNSTAGLEAAARGCPVVVCGAPHFRGKGFTIDISSKDEYRSLLRAWSEGEQVAAPQQAALLARRYVSLFYLRYHVTMGWTTSPLEPPYTLTIRSMDELLPGANANLDHVCDAILGARQVLLPRGVLPL